MKGFIYTFVIILLLAGVAAIVHNYAEAPVQPVVVATSTIPDMNSSDGTFLMKLYETKTVQDTTFNVWAVTEDSRCPIDVQCVWAGRVIIAMNIATAMGTSTQELELGKFVTTENKKITLVEVTPAQKQNHKIADGEYAFIFKIEAHNPAVTQPKPQPMQPTPQPSCYVGGCSSHVCSDTPNISSTCEWTEAYACYKGATCERQPSGQCGWTQTPELSKCLSNAR